MKTVTRIALIAGGTAAVAAGAVGLVLPVLPTTPFLLLAAVCFARSSPRFYRWLVTNRWCGAYIRNYREGHGITRRHKAVVLLLLWLTIGYSAAFAISRGWVKILLLAIAAAVTVHVLRIKTCAPPAPTDAPRDADRLDAPAPSPLLNGDLPGNPSCSP